MQRIIVILMIAVLSAASVPAGDISGKIVPAEYVNPFIGTAGGGNTFPGALLPWGMVSVSPHTAPSSPSGYLSGQPWLYGFGHVHLSGTGCAELGSIVVMIVRDSLQINPSSYRSAFHAEQAHPGCYRVELDLPRILAEASTTTRSGKIRFTAKESGVYYILIDAGTSLSLRGGGLVHFDSDQTVSGYNISGGFCGEANREKIYFFSELSKETIDHGVWAGQRISRQDSASVDSDALGAWLKIKLQAGESVSVKTGISYVSEENARLNLRTEQPGWDFELVKSAAWDAWNKELSRILIEDESRENLVKFYSALYHCLIHPNIIRDINGEYPLMGQRGTGRYGDRLRYSVFSLWDTYRTLHPLLTLVYPGKQLEMIRTMLDMYRENEYLPKWELAGMETYMMVGDPASIVIADSYVKGLDGFDTDLALEAIRRPASLLPGEKAPPVRAAYHYILDLGYIPFDQDMHDAWWAWGPVSTSLEYNLADWAIGEMAAGMVLEQIALEFSRRAQGYQNLFDQSTRFMRPRLKNGEWLTPFDSLTTEGSGDWEGSGGPGYVEGNAWNYTFFVPHDIAGLIELFGGEEAFIKKLRRCFDEGHFTLTNEPDMAYPYLFTYVNRYADITPRLVQGFMDRYFGTGPDGLPGNDDCGTISAWFVFSALGFFPACPASEYYQLGIPLFDRLTIHSAEKIYPESGFKIEKKAKNTRQSQLEKIRLNGKTLNGHQILHKQITSGGLLVFEMD